MARKPIPGSDVGTWGQVLNDFLDVAHNTDGTLKDGAVGAGALNAGTPVTGQVLSWNGSGLSWTASGNGLLDSTAVSSSYTLTLNDQGKVVEVTGVSPMTITIPPNASVAFPIGAVLEIYQYGVGQVVIAPGAGVTLRAAGGRTTLAGQYSSAALRKRGTNEWTLVGDLTD